MEKLVPLISSTVAGPLGAVHLPRMWLKSIFYETGMLADGWNPHYRAFNQTVLDSLGVDHEAFFAYLATLPTYPDTERWVRANATTLSAETLAASNEAILSRQQPEERAAAVRDNVGLDDSTERTGVRINDLDDWYTVHVWIVEHRDAVPAMIPLVSSTSHGPLGLRHLPRLWMKATLKSVGALPEGWNSGGGFDRFASGELGLDFDAAAAMIAAELPDYLTFERWVAEHVRLDEAKRAAYDAAVLTREKPPERVAAERVEAGMPELTQRTSMIINDLVDWIHIHRRVVERRDALSGT